ncbi:MAG: hypothetical protein ACJAUP_001440 [Cellvibrionaceae bacterium]|jgi:hypothetical protein
MTLADITLFFFLILFAGMIWKHIDASRIARFSAKKYCDKQGVQFLDQNVILKRLKIAKSPHSLFAFKRHYNFEFSSIGDRRYRGDIYLLGQRVIYIELEPYKMPEGF